MKAGSTSNEDRFNGDGNTILKPRTEKPLVSLPNEGNMRSMKVKYCSNAKTLKCSLKCSPRRRSLKGIKKKL